MQEKEELGDHTEDCAMTWRVAGVRLASLSGLALVACLASAAKRFDLSSLASDYTPAARIWGRAETADSTVVVHVDSVLVAVPGMHVANAPPSVGRLSLRVLIAVADTAKWRPLELSDVVPLRDTLRFGEAVMIRGLTLTVAKPAGVALDQSFLVFELRGRALQRADLGESVRTFVCSADYLRSRPGAAKVRAALLAQAYTRAC